MQVPSGVIAGAAATAVNLGKILRSVEFPLPADAAAALGIAARRIMIVSAPRLASRADVALLGGDLVTTLQTAARAANPTDAAPALYRAANASSKAAPRSASPSLTRDFALSRALAAGFEVACLGEAFVAEARTAFGDRRAATEARDRISAALDAAQDRVAAALGEAVLAILGTAAREASNYLVRLGADLQPIVRVDTRISVPSTALAWSLYADPARAAELVARNRVGTPLFMPVVVEAVAPGAS